jgi:pyruvate dehydrogenase E2 component (dihydrolipoamide acetyltransferase)
MDVRLPKLGENAEGGSVVSILVKEGETVTMGQTILELENEKAVAPIPSTAAGVVSQIRVKEGDRLSVGQVILTVNEAGASGSAAPAPAGAEAKAAKAGSAPAPAASPRPTAARPNGAAEAPGAGADEDGAPVVAPDGPVPPASPEIRRVARELGLDLRLVGATGAGGRVEWPHLRAYLERLQRLAQRSRAAAPASGAPAGGGVAGPVVEPIDFSKWGAVERKPMAMLRKTISRRMSDSWHAVPRVTQFDQADITDLMELRKKFSAAYEKQGVRLTLTSFALRAVAQTLRKHPVFNSSLDAARDEIVLKNYVHLGLAVDTEHGLMVPVIREADRKSLLELSRDVQELAAKARERKLSLDDMKGGTFTISNQGGIGGGHFTPIINLPEVAILGLGQGAQQAMVREGKIVPRLMLPLAVSYDHRVIDGAAAARFAVDLVAALQGFTDADVKL